MTRSKKKYKFSSSGYSSGGYPSSRGFIPYSSSTVQENQNNTADFVAFSNHISKFNEWKRDELYENMYIYEASIASAVDSFSIMVRESYNYIDAKYVNKPRSLLSKLKDKLLIGDKTLIDEMLLQANDIASTIHIEDIYEAYASMLIIFGNLYLEKNKDLSLSVIPNYKVTIIDKLERINGGMQSTEDLIIQPNYLIIDEGLDTQRILNKDQFFNIRFRDTPLIVEDSKCRLTFGIYSVSPLRRAIIPVWYKRIAMANDALWRAKSVPREHHKLDKESFNTINYTGTPDVRAAKAQADIATAISNYKANLTSQAPDQGYVTVSNVEIDMVEPSSTSYMRANELIEQMNQETYSAMNLPQSVIKGVSGSNYASELVISAYTSSKVKQIAQKISYALLENIKDRLKIINPKFPVDQLDIKVSFTLANSRLEQFKIAQVMASMGIYTANEIREVTEHEPLEDKDNILVYTGSSITPATPEPEEPQENSLNQPNKQKTPNNGGQSLSSDGSVNYPSTPQSANQQPTDSPTAIYNKSTRDK